MLNVCFTTYLVLLLNEIKYTISISIYMKKHILIVGGGFAGINLIKSLKNDNRFKITLVDKNNYHFFHH